MESSPSRFRRNNETRYHPDCCRAVQQSAHATGAAQIEPVSVLPSSGAKGTYSRQSKKEIESERGGLIFFGTYFPLFSN